MIYNKIKCKKFFITATDTDVGKTVVSLLLMKFLFQKKFNPFYIKPVQTGCINPNDEYSDANFVYKNLKQFNIKNPSDSVIYCFNEPKAPYFAALNKNQTIDINKLKKVIEAKEKLYDCLVIEGAGGLLVPITKNFLIIDLINTINAEPILVSRAGLGTINHTLLSIEALRNRNLEPEMVIFTDSNNEKTNEKMIKENIEAIQNISNIKNYAFLQKIDNFFKLDIDAYNIFEKYFSSSN